VRQEQDKEGKGFKAVEIVEGVTTQETEIISLRVMIKGIVPRDVSEIIPFYLYVARYNVIVFYRVSCKLSYIKADILTLCRTALLDPSWNLYTALNLFTGISTAAGAEHFD